MSSKETLASTPPTSSQDLPTKSTHQNNRMRDDERQKETAEERQSSIEEKRDDRFTERWRWRMRENISPALPREGNSKKRECEPWVEMIEVTRGLRLRKREATDERIEIKREGTGT